VSGGPAGARVHATGAWGRNTRSADLPNCFATAGCLPPAIPYAPARVQDAFLLEATLLAGARHIFFTRAEHVEKDGLFAGNDPFHPRVFPVGSLLGGYLHELPLRGRVGVRAGGAAGLGFVPEFIEPDFGGRRPFSWWLIAQVRLR
jgi:hypothetical protein